VKELQSYFLNVEVHDPHASSDELKHEYGFGLTEKIGKDYDAVIISVCHTDYMQHDNAFFNSITKPNALIADLKGAFRKTIKDRQYWSF
jgi:UDP-N-acetyl-D-glucosamine/UDP-N-acetyl-D-galactosamine dehydrogenase